MNELSRLLTGLLTPLAQITVTLRPGEKVCDQNITLERWLAFSGSVAGLALFLGILWVNSAAEVGLSGLSRQRLRAMKERHESRARLVDELLNRTTQVGSAISVMNTVSLIGAAALALSAIHQFNLYGLEVTLMVLVLTFVILSLVRAVPKGYAQNNPEVAALRYSGIINLETASARPLVWLVNAAANQVLKLSSLKPLPADTVVSEEEMALLANIGEEEGLIQEDERAMIRGIFQFSDTAVREVMLPRLDVKAIPAGASLEETLDAIINSGKSRLPIYHPDIDHITGILYAKDLLRHLRLNPGQARLDLAQLVRPAYYVPESKKIDQLFAELQKAHIHIAIVVDEYGGTAGLVTIEDLLEEIVGDIQDEFDVETANLERVGPAEVLVDARLNLNEVNEIFKTNWEANDVDTVGGFVYSRLGRIPVEGDYLIVDQAGQPVQLDPAGLPVGPEKESPGPEAEGNLLTYYRISVIKATAQRLLQLRIQQIQVPPVNPVESQPEGLAPNGEAPKDPKSPSAPTSPDSKRRDPESPPLRGGNQRRQPLSE